MRSGLNRLRWRLRPGRFVPVACGSVDLDAVAVPVASPAALATGEAPAAYVELAPGGEQVLRPLFLLGDPAKGGTALLDRPLSVPPVRIYRLRGGMRVFGKGLFMRANGDVLALPSFLFHELGRRDYPANALSLSPAREWNGLVARMPARTLELEGPCLYLAQGGEGVWGHWLVDLLPRLMAALAVPLAMRVIVDADTPRWADELLGAAGIGPERIVRHDKFRFTLRADDLVVPSFLRHADAFSPLANLAWGRLAAGGPPPGPALRLWVSRGRGAGGSTIANAPAIEDLARRRGYRVVHAERLNLDAKRHLFGRASHVAGEFGSGLHNTVFSPAGTRVAVFQSAASDSFVQSGIGAERGQPTGIVFGPAVAPGSRAFTIPPDLAAAALDRLDGAC